MSVEQYLEFVLIDHMLSAEFDNQACERWIPTADVKRSFSDAVDASLGKYGYKVGNRYQEQVDKHWAGLVSFGALVFEGDEFTGEYSYCGGTQKDNYLKAVLGQHPVANRIKALGQPALSRALSVIAGQEGWSLEQVAEYGQDVSELRAESDRAPASDRIVLFSDNQVDELDTQTTEVIDAVAALNRIDDSPGLREIIIGQLKAGRELIRAGSFRLYLLEFTLIETLRFLANRYEKELIGGLAAALMTALAKHIGIDA